MYLGEATKALTAANVNVKSQLVRINPQELPSLIQNPGQTEGIIIRYGAASVILPEGTNISTVAELVCALNSHA